MLGVDSELTKHAPVLEEPEKANGFFMRLGGGLELDDRTVGTDDLVRWKDQERRRNADEDDHQERL